MSRISCGERLLGAADQHVGLDTDAAQLVDRVLRRLGLQLAGVRDVRHEREVDEDAVLAAAVLLELADGFEERQALDVADGAADLGDDDVDVLGLGDQVDARLDLVGDVRDDLHGAAEVVAAALLADDLVVDRAGGDVAAARSVGVGEALVVAEVEVGLGAVVGDEDLAVLERAHRARVDVDVRVELLDLDAQAAGLEQAADCGRGDAFSERRNDASGDEDEARVSVSDWAIRSLPKWSRNRNTGVRSINCEIDLNSPYSVIKTARRRERSAAPSCSG